MENRIYCPVCRIHFVSKDLLEPGIEVICLVCGARLEITEVGPQISARKVPQEPREEIYDRVETYAYLKGYVFDENKEDIMTGLMEKKSSLVIFTVLAALIMSRKISVLARKPAATQFGKMKAVYEDFFTYQDRFCPKIDFSLF